MKKVLKIELHKGVIITKICVGVGLPRERDARVTIMSCVDRM